MTKPDVLCFCVGATKASTTWLYRVLSRHPECHLRSIKELHFFDSLDAQTVRVQIVRIRAQLAGCKAAQQTAPTADLESRMRDLEAWLAVLKSGSTDDYVAYLAAGGAGRRLMADVTPSYALLSADRLRQMAGLWPDVRFVYLIRDPVARLWSHVRMSAWRQSGDAAAKAAELFDAAIAGTQPDIMARGDYRAAIARLDAAIDPSRLLIMFQEVMLTVPGVQQICAFLGISAPEVDLKQRVHAGPSLAMTTDQIDRARRALRPQYDFVAARFGHLPDAWLRNMKEGVA